MEPYEERILKEREELDEKLFKLQAFTSSDFFKTLSLTEQELLDEQVTHMYSYVSVLTRRLNLIESRRLGIITRAEEDEE